MNYKIIEHETKKYMEVLSVNTLLSTEQDALNLIALCRENDISLLILHSHTLAEAFFELKTGVAGKMLQKFINYHVKIAAIIPKDLAHKGKFKEMVLESNKGSHFRVFENRETAEEWLLKNE